MKKLLVMMLAAMLAISATAAFAEDSGVIEQSEVVEEAAEETAGFAEYAVPVEELKATEANASTDIVIEKKYLDGDKICFDIRNNTQDVVDAYFYYIVVDENGNAIMTNKYGDDISDYINDYASYDIEPGTVKTAYTYLPDGCAPAGIRAIVCSWKATNDAGTTPTMVAPAAGDWYRVAIAAMPGIEVSEFPIEVNESNFALKVNKAYAVKEEGVEGKTIVLEVSYDESETNSPVRFFRISAFGYDAAGNPVCISQPESTGSAYESIRNEYTSSMIYGDIIPGMTALHLVDVKAPDNVVSMSLVVKDIATEGDNVDNPEAEAWKESYHQDAIVAFD